MTFKEEVYGASLDLLITKIAHLQQTLSDLNESAKNETKSTAGDKHETALAMLQLEQEKIRRQLKETNEQKVIFESIDPLLKGEEVRKGSLVKTDKSWLFMSAGIGKITLTNETIISLSPLSPLGMKMMGKKINDTIKMNAVVYKIEKID
jgi:transcription elongation GreA/GreB family factor